MNHTFSIFLMGEMLERKATGHLYLVILYLLSENFCLHSHLTAPSHFSKPHTPEHSYSLSLSLSPFSPSHIILLLSSARLPPAVSPLLSLPSVAPPRSPPTVWTAAVSPQPPVFLVAASAGEGSPFGKTLFSPPLPPPTLLVW